MANIQITIPDAKLQEAITAICWDLPTPIPPTAANAKKTVIKKIVDSMAKKKRTDLTKAAIANLPPPDDNSDIT